jgi:hypothetical protein
MQTNRQIQKLTVADALEEHKKALLAIENPDRIKWKTECASNRRFFYNEQWQDSDKRLTQETEGRYLITLNRTKKYIETQVGLLTAETPMIRVKPFGTEDNIISDIANAVLSHVFNGSVGKVMLNRIIKFGLVDNIAYAYVKKNKLNRIVFDCLFYDEVVPDSYSTDPYFRDSESYYMVQYVNVEKVKAIYGLEDSDLPTDFPIDYSVETNSSGERNVYEKIWDKSKRNIKLTHIFTKKYQTIYNTEMIDGLPVQVASGNYKELISKKTLIGFNNLWEEILPEAISEHNIVPFYGEDTPNVLKQGRLIDIKEQQQLLNASFGIMLFHAQMSSVARGYFWEDQIPNNDIAGFKANVNKIGSFNILRGDGKDTAPPIFQQPSPLPNAWFEMTQLMMNEMQFNMIPDQLMGMDSKQGNRQTEIYRNYELMLNSMRTLFIIYEGFFSVLGKVILQYFFAYTDKESIARITSAKDMIEDITEAAQKGLNITDPNAVQQYLLQHVEAGENEYDIKRDIRALTHKYKYVKALEAMMQNADWTHFDISIEKGSYLPSHSMMRFFLKYELFKDGIVDNETVLEDMPIANRDAIIDRISTINLVSQENSELKIGMGKMQAQIDMLNEALANSKTAIVEQETYSKFDKQKNDFVQKERANVKIANVNRRFETKEQIQTMQRELDKTLLALEYEKMRAKLAQQAKNDVTMNDSGVSVEEMIHRAIEKKNDN